MSTTYIAQVVALLAFFLPKWGISIGSEELTGIVQAVAVLGAALWTLYRRYKVGDLTIVGSRR